MTTKKFCDICGKDITDQSINGNNHLIIDHLHGIGTDKPSRHRSTYDLCDVCADELWIKTFEIKEGKLK